MIIPDSIKRQLETPCLIIDLEQSRRNINGMQKVVDQAGCTLRPHVKTHKMPFFAHLQREAGAVGITCAKVSEAQVFAAAGLDDIFIAYPLVGAFRINRAIALAKQVKRLILAVDSFAGAQALSAAATAAALNLEVRLEIDTGAQRTGVLRQEAAALVAALIELPGLNLTGIYTFKSLIYQGQATTDNEKAAVEEGALLKQTAQEIEERGIHLKDISGGSSPTGRALAQTGAVTEIRPGTYIFNDLMLCNEGVATVQDIAVRFVATVVSCPRADYAIIDGGTKCFPTDQPLHSAPFNYQGYAVVEGKEELRLDRMNEEHGIITARTGKTGLSVGQIITLLPLHVCTAINMHNTVYLLEQNTVRIMPVQARGMLV
ncbi:MAG: alanine racemase [Spirochaetaceae bacterium]|jgi:D-serine deaminase-like pyridoxal phosphate-dependent protein|nr:alanine racemase [Spirochaetaceae bacterium]